MTTALAIISRSMRMLGIYANGEVPTGAEATDALSVFNSLVQSLGLESLLVFADSTDEITFAQGQAFASIGPSGTTVSPRPVRVLSTSYVQLGDISYALETLSDAEYNEISLKSLTTGIPSAIYVDNTFPDTRVYLYPIPAQEVKLVLHSNKRLGTFALNDNLSFPDGYDRMLAYCLALEIAPEYGLQAPPDVLRNAMGAKRIIKRANAQIPRLCMPGGIPGSGWGAGVSGGRAGGQAIINTDGEFLVYTE